MRTLILALLIGLTSSTSSLRSEVEEVKPIKIGLAGFAKSDAKGKLSARPLVDYLQAGLGRPVQIISYPGYSDVMVTLGNGGIELALLPPVVNLHATDAGLSKPLAYGIYATGTYTYRAYVVARKDDPKIKDIKDLKGQKVAFVDVNSASGYVWPKITMRDNGVEPKEVEDVFAGNHPAALKSLESGQVAAAAVYELLFHPSNVEPKNLANYRVLATTDPVAAEAVVATDRLKPADAAKVRDLLLSYHARRNEKKEWAEGRYIGFVPADPFVLAGVRRTYRRLIPETR